ncbi:sulfurtransferase [Ectothiorhodospira haloalkaliphila]|uniref:Sulfurtransferase n=1 Tax=Ectothiorhodospira haloalkaliphila TaxID=421628 RepID=W8KL31_9GAMM|nr:MULTISPECIES: rhodanese-like domain-containing protein [Ectothiorhodospira]AHK79883.1 sulfurtransferase [Ectothiorhodospira haloalkaliphila]MCG5493312.1 rhodanese-like domain-containing protein [Ectothiorhodospira variabilis]MCG5496656.1 rhodanese-like domain-containing protein [Ectothiorhodospira variabilis]MCG5502641.1 rhodanese-like domain-containing protein [Ectothiorhodospira variabilis]MCG5505593.1 rhodanese-like domain-containing protein [Ectothiorhodospira variabilis]
MPDQEPANLSPREAYDMLQADPKALLVDIRSSMEFLFVGHPVGAVHIPWMDEPDWTLNPRFTTEVRKLLLGGASGQHQGEGGAPVILICRSGKRSLEAGRVLLEDGLPRVFHVGEGFEGDLNDKHQRSSVGGWRYHGLPWEQC